MGARSQTTARVAASLSSEQSTHRSPTRHIHYVQGFPDERVLRWWSFSTSAALRGYPLQRRLASIEERRYPFSSPAVVLGSSLPVTRPRLPPAVARPLPLGTLSLPAVRLSVSRAGSRLAVLVAWDLSYAATPRSSTTNFLKGQVCYLTKFTRTLRNTRSSKHESRT